MTTPSATPDTPTSFADLGLDAPLIETLASLGYEEPTPIQAAAIPTLLAGRDLLGQAGTGTGKTAAFALPMLQRHATREADGRDGVRGLILVPTRELALQVGEALHRYGRSLRASVLPIYGGQPIQTQLRALSRGVDVVVATPGRALDHIRRGSLDLSRVRMVVLDEADEMLDMGFADDLEAILEGLPEERQAALFSATMPPRIAALAEGHLRNPERVNIARERTAAGEMPRVRQVAFVVRRPEKIMALGRVLDMESPASAIVFCRTRTEVDTLAESLNGRGRRAEALHGGLSQEQRDRVMRRFRDGTAELLVATDVAARGLDVEHVSHVVNYDVPSSPDVYVHRIGRTGRAGRAGVAITLVEPREHRMLRNIEHLTGQKLAVEQVPTVVDLRARRLDLLRGSIEETILEGDLERFRVVVENLATDHDVMDVAAAAVKRLHDLEAGDVDERDLPVLELPGRGDRPRDRGDRGDRGGFGRDRGDRGPRAQRADRPAREDRGDRPERGEREERGERPARGRPARSGPTGDVARVYIGVGRRGGIRPGDLVGAIANEAGLDARDIGAIEIADRFSLVEVPGDAATEVIRALRGTTIRGKKVMVRRDRDAE